LRFNNFATGLRELTRIVLHDRAPEKDVKGCCWFKQQFNEGKPIITRAQRVQYAIQAGLPEDFVENTLGIDVKSTLKEFKGIIDELNKFTHVEKETFDTDEDVAVQLADVALEMFDSLLRTIDDCRSEVRTALEDAARDALNDEMISNMVEDLDVLSTHSTVDQAHVEEFKLRSMGPKLLNFHGSGSVDCDLQYGSDSDNERGDGVRSSASFPLTCEFEADISSPLDLEVKNLSVDNSSFYE
jgi:hypothetical protein